MACNDSRVAVPEMTHWRNLTYVAAPGGGATRAVLFVPGGAYNTHSGAAREAAVQAAAFNATGFDVWTLFYRLPCSANQSWRPIEDVHSAG